MSRQDEKTAKEIRLRQVAVQLVAQMGNETPEDMVQTLGYAAELVEGFIKPAKPETPARLHSIAAARAERSAN